VTGVEALIRGQHPRQGLLYPDVFLPLAEQTGLIAPLTDWVIRTALAQIGLWGHDAEDISVAVNVSARNLSQPGFPDSVLAALAHSRTPRAASSSRSPRLLCSPMSTGPLPP